VLKIIENEITPPKNKQVLIKVLARGVGLTGVAMRLSARSYPLEAKFQSVKYMRPSQL
jgi:hypothetical protein